MAYTHCTHRGPTQLLTILGCMTMLHMFGVSPGLTLEQPHALFVVNEPSKAEAPVAAPGPAPGPAPVLSLHDMVLNALRAAGPYGQVAGAIETLADTYPIIRPNVTFFAPDDNAVVNGFPFNSTPILTTLLNYHTASQNYNFQDLLNLKVGDRIPTVAPEIIIVVNNVANPGYQLDNAFISKPNLYSTGVISVHGINAIFNTRFYNTAVLGPVPAPAPVGAAAPGSSSASSSTSSGTKTDSNDAAHLSRASFGLILVGVIAVMLLCPL